MAIETFAKTRDGMSLSACVEGDGPPLLLCHGGPGLWDYLGDLALALIHEFQVCRWDQRGCGRSEPSAPYGLDVAVQDVQDLKRALGIDEPWVVVGHSWGAYLGLLTALEHPETTAALVYISGTGTPQSWREFGSATYRSARASRMEAHELRRLDELEVKHRSWDEEVEFRRLSWMTDFVDAVTSNEALDAMATTRLPINYDVNRILSHAELYPNQQLLDACETCQVPSLFLHGAEDPRPARGAKLLSQRVAGAEFVLVEDAGHLPWVERPVETLQTIGDFLGGCL